MSSLMYADMGLSVAAGLTNYMVGKETSKLNRSIQAYQNTMAALSTGRSLNNITRNEIGMRDAAAFAQVSIQSQALEEQAAFQVEAAAAGVIGNSVAVGLRARQGDAARAKTSLNRQFEAEQLNIEDQRTAVKMSEIYNRDISPISKPNLGATLLSTGANLIATWDAHNPEDRRSSSLLARG